MSDKKNTKTKENWVYFERVAVNLAALNPNRARLDPDDKKAWIDALWFGFYRQAKDYLCVEGSDVPNNNFSFCCLGVKHRVEGYDNERLLERLCYFGQDQSILRSDGNFDDSIWGSVTFDNKIYDKLANLNDAGASFKEIAFVIEHVF